MNTTLGLPAAWYCEPDPFQRERHRLFGANWLMLGRADALAGPGRYVAANIGGWPLFAIADETGAPGAFRNVCRHQQLAVLENGAGRCAQLRCRYHGWTYRLDGGFREAPPAVAPKDSGAAEHNLVPVRHAVWGGLVLVHPGEPTEPAAAVMAAIEADWPRVDGERWQFAGETPFDSRANWKLLVDGLLGGIGERDDAAVEHRGGIATIVTGARETWLWQWPALAVSLLPGLATIHRLVPHSFRRSQYIQHHYVDASAPAEQVAGARARLADFAAALCRETDALQSGLDDDAARGATLPHAGAPALSLFHRLVGGVHHAAG